jgi:cold shock protein|tara:strand:+ start:235 stop:441 length:207 start_codon:yes stop_codon:yes gene_type:complete
MATGTVKFFKTDKGYGFITPEDGSRDVFVHVSAVQNSGLATISEGQRLNFEIQEDARGPKAVDLSVAD